METISPKNEAGTKVADAAPVGDRVAELINKPRRGRPPGSKTGGGNAVPSRAPRVPERSPDDAKQACTFFVESALFLFEGTDEFIKRGLLDRLKRYVRDDKRVAEFEAGVWNKNTFSERDRERLRFLLTQLALKYPILQKVGPEIGLAVFLVQYGMKTLALARAIESLKVAPVVAQPKPAT